MLTGMLPLRLLRGGAFAARCGHQLYTDPRKLDALTAEQRSRQGTQRRRDRIALVVGIVSVLVSIGMVVGCRQPTQPGGDDDPEPAPGISAADLAFCVEETNRRRAQAGVGPLERAADVEAFAQAAAAHAHETGLAHRYVAEHGPPRNGAWAENQVIRWSASTDTRAFIAAAITHFWAEGPTGPHHRNLVGPYRVVGCGVVRDRDNLATLSQDFAQ